MWRMIGYSSVIPLPPRIVRAVRAASIAPRTLPILPRLTWCGCSVPASFMPPRCSATIVPRFTLRAIPANFGCGDRPVRDPHLRPVEDPVAPVPARGRAHRAGVGAGVGLGQPEAAEQLARVHGRQPALLLLLRAPPPDREHRQRALHRHEAAH